jgi:hypothetical protein
MFYIVFVEDSRFSARSFPTQSVSPILREKSAAIYFGIAAANLLSLSAQPAQLSECEIAEFYADSPSNPVIASANGSVSLPTILNGERID